jgi:hypothetical protein
MEKVDDAGNEWQFIRYDTQNANWLLQCILFFPLRHLFLCLLARLTL